MAFDKYGVQQVGRISGRYGFFGLIISENEFRAVVSQSANGDILRSVAPFKVRVPGNEMRLPRDSHANENPTAASRREEKEVAE